MSQRATPAARSNAAPAAKVAHSLQDLKHIRQQLEQDRAEAAAREKARQEAERRARDAHRLFELAVGPVHRMRPPRHRGARTAAAPAHSRAAPAGRTTGAARIDQR